VRYSIVGISSYKALISGSTVPALGSSTVLAIGSARRRISTRLVNRSVGILVQYLLVYRAVIIWA